MLCVVSNRRVLSGDGIFTCGRDGVPFHIRVGGSGVPVIITTSQK